MVLTQLMGLRLRVLLVLSGACFVTGVVVLGLEVGESISGKQMGLEVLLVGVCGLVNLAVLYGGSFDSKKNFILREQIEMQTNQTNDIWTILVPEFVRNFFAENDKDGGQYKEKSVAILFCYVCNFD